MACMGAHLVTRNMQYRSFLHGITISDAFAGFNLHNLGMIATDVGIIHDDSS